MCDGRLSDIAVLSIESKRAQTIDFESFVDEFDESTRLRCGYYVALAYFRYSAT